MAVGLVPINFQHKSTESALSVYPLAIANCKENRSDLSQPSNKIIDILSFLKQTCQQAIAVQHVVVLLYC